MLKDPKFPSIVPLVIIIVRLLGEKFSNRNVDRGYIDWVVGMD